MCTSSAGRASRTGDPGATSSELDTVTLDLGADNRIVGIEILDASHHVDLAGLMPVTYESNDKRTQAV